MNSLKFRREGTGQMKTFDEELMGDSWQNICTSYRNL